MLELMNPPSKGPKLGPVSLSVQPRPVFEAATIPMNGLSENIAIGAWISSGLNTSLTVPPATVRNALLAKPSKKRAYVPFVSHHRRLSMVCWRLTMIMVSAFLATADGINHIKNMDLFHL